MILYFVCIYKTRRIISLTISIVSKWRCNLVSEDMLQWMGGSRRKVTAVSLVLVQICVDLKLFFDYDENLY